MKKKWGESPDHSKVDSPMGPINPYMAAKFLPNSLSFSHSPYFLMPSLSEQADPWLNG